MDRALSKLSKESDWPKGILDRRDLGLRERRPGSGTTRFSMALSKTRSALDSIKGETRIVETQTAGQRDAVAKGLAPSGEMRGPESSRGYPEHMNPSDGPYSDVHVQVQGQRQSGSGRARSEDSLFSAMGAGGILGEIFAPTTSALSASGDATPGELASAAIWDATSTVDPSGLTDLIGMYYDLP